MVTTASLFNIYVIDKISGFDNEQRKVMHEIARRFGLKSKSFGKGDNRHLTISRKLDPRR